MKVRSSASNRTASYKGPIKRLKIIIWIITYFFHFLSDSPEIVTIWLRDKDGIAGHENPKTYNFNEDVNIRTTLRINSNPESKLLLRSSLKIYQLNHTKVATDYKSKLPSLKCEDSGNFEIQARNGIPYGDNRTVNFIISCK